MGEIWFREYCFGRVIRKAPCHVRKMFLSAILGPEMAAPILWAPGIFWLFLQENLHAYKIPRFEGFLGSFWRGVVGEVPILL